MSGARRLAVSELSIGKYKNLKEEAYLNMVEEEMLDADEGSEEDLKEDAGEGISVKVENLGK